MNPYVQLLGAALSIWEHREKNKYFERYQKLTKVISDEESKPLHKMDRNRIDLAHRDLLLLGSRFATQVGGQKPSPKS
jgi:hypothetical protein